MPFGGPGAVMRVSFTNRQRRYDASFRAEAERIAAEVAQACWDSLHSLPSSPSTPYGPSVHFVFAGPRVMRSINAETRGVDSTTDVLSFPMTGMREGRWTGRVLPEDLSPSDDGDGSILFLGDILLSLDRAVEQADRFEHPVSREIAFLAAHAVLHLLGYDHDTPERERRMRRKQRSVLQPLGYRRTP